MTHGGVAAFLQPHIAAMLLLRLLRRRLLHPSRSAPVQGRLRACCNSNVGKVQIIKQQPQQRTCPGQAPGVPSSHQSCTGWGQGRGGWVRVVWAGVMVGRWEGVWVRACGGGGSGRHMRVNSTAGEACGVMQAGQAQQQQLGTGRTAGNRTVSVDRIPLSDPMEDALLGVLPCPPCLPRLLQPREAWPSFSVALRDASPIICFRHAWCCAFSEWGYVLWMAPNCVQGKCLYKGSFTHW